MSKEEGLPIYDMSLRQKRHYEEWLQRNPKYPTPFYEENEKMKASEVQQVPVVDKV